MRFLDIKVRLPSSVRVVLWNLRERNSLESQPSVANYSFGRRTLTLPYPIELLTINI